MSARYQLTTRCKKTGLIIGISRPITLAAAKRIARSTDDVVDIVEHANPSRRHYARNLKVRVDIEEERS